MASADSIVFSSKWCSFLRLCTLAYAVRRCRHLLEKAGGVHICQVLWSQYRVLYADMDFRFGTVWSFTKSMDVFNSFPQIFLSLTLTNVNSTVLLSLLKSPGGPINCMIFLVYIAFKVFQFLSYHSIQLVIHSCCACIEITHEKYPPTYIL